MGDPVGGAAPIHKALKPDGTFMAVEPAAGDKLEENFHPLGRIAYAASTMVCVPTSLAQGEHLTLGVSFCSIRVRRTGQS